MNWWVVAVVFCSPFVLLGIVARMVLRRALPAVRQSPPVLRIMK